MHSAADKGHLQIVELLLSKGAEVDSGDKVRIYVRIYVCIYICTYVCIIIYIIIIQSSLWYCMYAYKYTEAIVDSAYRLYILAAKDVHRVN